VEGRRGPTSLSLGRLAELRRVRALFRDDWVHGVSFQFKLRLEWWG